MSTKPASVGRWAANAPGTITGAVTVPTSGKKDIGFIPGERGAAQYLDWLFELAYEWEQYLSDGAMSGTFTFDNTVGITGLLTATAGVTCGANSHVTISGAGKYKRGSKIRHISAMGGTAGGSSLFLTGSDGFGDTVFLGVWKGTATGDLLAIPVPYNDDERITQIQAVVRGDATAQVKMTLYRSSDPASAGSRVTGATCATGNSDHTITLSSLTEVGGAGTFYYLIFLVVGAVTANVLVNGADVTIDVP